MTLGEEGRPGYVLSGEKFVVGHGDTADTLIVTARTAGGQRDAKGVGVSQSKVVREIDGRCSLRVT